MQKQKEKNPLIPLSKAAHGTPYSEEYLSLLARKGKLPAVKRANTWFTTREHVREYMEAVQSGTPVAMKKIEQKPAEGINGLLSINDAAKAVPGYSQDYLSLRIRQGKLRGKKIGRNWYTTLEWIQEYVEDHAIKEVWPTESSSPAERASLSRAPRAPHPSPAAAFRFLSALVPQAT